MKLTCCCGASIEMTISELVNGIKSEHHSKIIAGMNKDFEDFKRDHQPCLDRWIASIPEPTFADKILGNIYLNPAFYRDLRDFPSADKWLQKPIVQHGDQAIKGICCHCGSSMVYRRIDGITVICYSCCNLNVAPPDPYARFRQAQRDEKRVFRSLSGRMHLVPMLDPLSAQEIWTILCPAEDMVIEGVDIPMQPTQEWLDEIGYESSGECRAPKPGEQYCAITDSGIVTRRVDIPVELPHFSGRRWIVRKKQADDGFEKWYEENKLSLAFETNPRYSHTVLKRTWTAAQKAKP